MDPLLIAPTILYTIASIIGIIGSSLVIHFSTKGRGTGVLRHLNQVVKNLAIADLLYALCGAPLFIKFSIWSKF